MNKLLLAGLATATALAPVPPAHAHPNWHYEGGCGFITVSDGTNSPATSWEGEIHVVAVATDATRFPDPTASITVECELRINGATPGTIVFTCTTPGVGFVACAGQFAFNAHPNDIVTMCDVVTVNGEVHKDCNQATQIPLVPQPIQNVIDEAQATVDRVACDTIAAQSGGPADQPPAFDIRSDGDIYVAGEWFWDCPPYGSSGPADGGACDDDWDNDGDGYADWPADPGCADPADPDERGITACDDGLDNDRDGSTDSADPDCTDPGDTEEGNIVGDEVGCDDGLDNDGDGQTDSADPGCADRADPDERGTTACDDGADNDGDLRPDYPADAGCTGPADDTETAASVCDDGSDNDSDGAADYPQDAGCDGPGDGSERSATFPCDDGVDNDNDDFADYPADPGCNSATDPNETTIP